MIDPNRTGLASVNRICDCTRLLPMADKPITSGKWDHSTHYIGNRKAAERTIAKCGRDRSWRLTPFPLFENLSFMETEPGVVQ